MKNKRVYLSERADNVLKFYIEGLKIAGLIETINFIKPHAHIGQAIACHADEYMCCLPDGIYFGDPDKLGPIYPQDVFYNAAAVGNYLICSKFTSPDLIEKSMLKPIVVSQGYVKCNLAVIDDSHVITEDAGIYKVLNERTEINCLMINPHEIMLPGYDYGFIGGCCGRINDTVVFNGDLSRHSNYKEIIEFISNCGLEIKYFKDYQLTDIGSIIAY